MTSAPGRHCKNRIFEWAMTGALLGVGFEQVIWPGSFASSKLQFMLDVISGASLAVFCVMIGWVRAVALFLNGNWPVYGARVRMVASIGGAAVWIQMGLSLVLIQIQLDAPPSPSVPVFFSLVAAELYSTYRAASDARYR